jgi:hypothetical protein
VIGHVGGGTRNGGLHMFHTFSKVVTAAGIAAAVFSGVSVTALAAPAAHASAIALTATKPAKPAKPEPAKPAVALPPVSTVGPAQSISVQPGQGGGAAESVSEVPPANSGPSTCPPGQIACQTQISNTVQNEQNTFDYGGGAVGNGISSLISSVVVGVPTFFLNLVQGFFKAI